MFIRITIGLLICFQIVFAENQDNGYIKTKGSASLDFRMYGLFSLNKHTGSSITYKSFKSSQKAIRIGISVNGYQDWDSGTYDRIEYNTYSDTSYYDTTSYNTESPTRIENLQLDIQLLKYKVPYNSISMYYGYGSYFGYNLRKSRSQSKRTGKLIVSRDSKNLSNEKGYYLGLVGIIGTEWFINENFSLSAEYQNSLTLGHNEKNTDYNREISSGDYYSSDSFDSGYYYELQNRVLVGISVFFK